MNFDTTPESADDPKVMELLAEIRRVGGGILPDARPFYVPVIPDPSSEVNDCFVAVSERIAKDGGESIVGWTLRKETRLMMSAEFHSIWKSPAGKLLDVTPKGIPLIGESIVVPTSRILFVSAPEKVYEGKQVDNIRLNISGNPLIDDCIACHEAVFNIMNRGERAHQHGEIALLGKEASTYQLLMMGAAILTLAAEAGCKTKNSPCFCRSGKKFKFCCGEAARKALESARDFM